MHRGYVELSGPHAHPEYVVPSQPARQSASRRATPQVRRGMPGPGWITPRFRGAPRAREPHGAHAAPGEIFSRTAVHVLSGQSAPRGSGTPIRSDAPAPALGRPVPPSSAAGCEPVPPSCAAGCEPVPPSSAAGCEPVPPSCVPVSCVPGCAPVWAHEPSPPPPGSRPRGGVNPANPGLAWCLDMRS